MSYNGSGTFNINTAGQPVVTGTVISSTAFNALTADLGTGLSTAITKDGQTVATARIPFAAGINSSLVTDATNTTTGSIITAGGVGIAKALFVGTTLNVAGASTLAAITGTFNGTVGATTPATGAFTTLSATGAISTTIASKTAAFDAVGGSIYSSYNDATRTWRSGVGIISAGRYSIYDATGSTEVVGIPSTGLAVTGTLSATGTLSGGTSGTGYSFSGSAAAGSLTLDSSGNLGLGVTPSAWGTYKGLQVGGSAALWGPASTGAEAYLNANTYYNGTNRIYISTNFATEYSQSSGVHSWKTAASGTAGNAITFTQAMTLDASGNLLVGTTSNLLSAANRVTVSVNGTSSSALAFGVAGTRTAHIYSDTTELAIANGNGASGFITLQTNSAERARIDSSGNLGLGVTPSAWNTAGGTRAFEFQNNLGSGSVAGWFSSVSMLNNAIFSATGGGTMRYVANGVATQYQQTVGQHIWNTAASGTAGDAISFTQAMTLDASGNFLVGCTATPSGSVSGFEIVKNGATSSYFVTGCTSTAANTVGDFFNPNGRVGGISVSGSATTFSTSSDYRLKENVQPMTGALATVTALKPVTFNWKSDGSDGQGFIAHELQAVVPDCVTGEKDAVEMQQYEISPAIPATQDEEGNEVTAAVEAVMGEREVPRYQGIDTSFLVATLTAAIQEQQAIITALTTRITALEAK